MKNPYLAKMRECRGIKDKKERSRATFLILQEASRDESLTARQFDILYAERKKINAS